MTILSVLMCTTPDRHEMFNKLFADLMVQKLELMELHSTLGDVEILIDDSKRFLDGGLSIGKKREALVKRATGKYCNFLDSDENIAPNYLETLVRLCCQGKDVCTFRAIAKLDNYWAIYDMRFNQHNEQSTPDKTVLRGAWHTCPVRTEYAQRYEFEDISYGEDAKWMGKVLNDCRDEAHSDAVILQYNGNSMVSESNKIIKAGYA